MSSSGSLLQVTELQPCRVAGHAVRRFRLANASGVSVELMEFGATLLRFCVPDASRNPLPLNLSLTQLEQYEHNPAHFGSICGRSANRIAGARFTLNGRVYQLGQNKGDDHLHGGATGFSHRLWRGEPLRDADCVGVRFSYVSADGEEGYPGRLECQVEYRLNAACELSISYQADVQGGPTVVNLTHHSYWNLAGGGTIEDHELTVAADHIVAVDEHLIPTGELLEVAGTVFDFNTARRLGADLRQVQATGTAREAGYDHCFVVSNTRGVPAVLPLVARLSEPVSGRTLEVHSDQPGLQCYVGIHLDGSAAVGGYAQYSGVALECQQLPDAPNQPTFPSTVLNDGEVYRQQTVYRFLQNG